MEENIKEKVLNNTSEKLITFPSGDESVRKKICLVIYHDGLVVTTIYINNVLEKFREYFGKIFIVSEDGINLESLNTYDNTFVVSSVKPVNLVTDWTFILEPGEFPSLQFVENIKTILEEVKPEVNVIKFPLVICNFKDGEIMDILEPKARLFRQNPHLLTKQSQEEIVLEKFPVIKLFVNFEDLEPVK